MVRDQVAVTYIPPTLDRFPLSAQVQAGSNRYDLDVQYSRTAVRGMFDTQLPGTVFIKSFDAQLEQGQATCGMVRACSVATEDLPERCVNRTSKLFVLDRTPPVVYVGPLEPGSNQSSGGMMSLKVEVSCDDPESGLRPMAHFSLGTAGDPQRYLDDWPLELGSSAGNTTDSNVLGLSLAYRTSTRTGFSGFVTITDAFLANASVTIPQGELLIATMTCQNMVADDSSSRSLPLRYDDAPPVPGTQAHLQGHSVWISNFVWSEADLAFVGEPSRVPTQIVWQNFSDAGSGIAYYDVCVGDTPFLCTHENWTAHRNETTVNFTTVPTENGLYTSRFHVSVFAIDGRGLSIGVSVDAIIDTTPPNISDVSVSAATGVIAPDGVLVTNTTTLIVTLDEQPTDAETADEAVTVLLSAHTSSRDGVEGTLQNCSFESVRSNLTDATNVTNLAPTQWRAHCVIQDHASLCIDAVARDLMGHTSKTTSTCALIDQSAPLWPNVSSATINGTIKQLAHITHTRYNSSKVPGIDAAWPLPFDAESGVVAIDVLVCTVHACAAEPLVGVNQTTLFIPDDHSMLLEHTGLVWLRVGATNLAGGRSEILSNSIVAARGMPSSGRLTLLANIGGDDGFLSSVGEARLRIRGFEEPLLGVSFFELCVGTAPNSSDLMSSPCVNFTSATHGLDVVPGQKTDLTLEDFLVDHLLPPLNASHELWVTATACSPVGICTSATSNKLMVDLDDPNIGYITDGLLHPDEVEKSDAIVIACEHKGPSGDCYGWALTEVGSLESVQEHLNFDVATQTLPSGNLSTGLRQTRGHLLAATWGDFSDGTSGLARVEVCFGTCGVLLMNEACLGDLIPCTPMLDDSGLPLREGVALAQPVALPSGVIFYATVRAFDKSSRNVSISSAGSIFFNVPPISKPIVLLDGQLTGFKEGCSAFGASWEQFDDPGCDTPRTYTWQLCTQALDCHDEDALPINASSFITMSTDNARLEAGTQYILRVSSLGCAGVPSIEWSRGIICDETQPDMVGKGTVAGATVTLRSPFGYRALSNGDVAMVSWRNAFNEAESQLASAEICLTPMPANCSGAWTPVPEKSYLERRADSFNVTLDLSDQRLASANLLYAVVRVTNAVNLSTELPSESGLAIDREVPKLASLTIDDFTSAEPLVPCGLNRTFSLPVEWTSEEDAATRLTYRLKALLKNGSEDEQPLLLMVDGTPVEDRNEFEVDLEKDGEVLISHISPMPGSINATDHPLSNGSLLTFELTAFSWSRRHDSINMSCTVCSFPPPKGTVFVADRPALAEGSFATAATQDALAASQFGTPRLCWDGFDAGGLCSAVSYRLWWSLAGSTEVLGDATLAPNVTCVEDTPTLEGGKTYIVRVTATGVSGLISPPAEMRLVADNTAPKPPDTNEHVTVGGLSVGTPKPGHFAISSCCARVGWHPWSEPESMVVQYTMCVRQINGTATHCHAVDGTGGV